MVARERTMKKVLALLLFAFAAHAQTEPDYSTWTRLLKTYYDPARGMNYAALKAHDAATLENLKESLGRVNANALNPKQRLADWINVYNINTVATIVENYPVKSIRDLSGDPLIFTVFKKKRIPFLDDTLSLDDVENKRIRDVFHDPRIHFAINCAADLIHSPVFKKFPDVTVALSEGGIGWIPYFLERLDHSYRTHKAWTGADFGDKTAFLRKYLPADKQKLIDAANGKIELAYDDYDWTLNDRR